MKRAIAVLVIAFILIVSIVGFVYGENPSKTGPLELRSQKTRRALGYMQ